jgi:DNA polymerase I-like protein with 3'-5' exonuclease and polymerase domains
MLEIQSNPFLVQAYNNVLVEIMRELCLIEYAGVQIDMKKNAELRSKYEMELEDINISILKNPLVFKSLIPRIPVLEKRTLLDNGKRLLSLTSTAQLAKLFYQDLKLPSEGVKKGKPNKKTGKSTPSTSKEVLRKFTEEFKDIANKLGYYDEVTSEDGKDVTKVYPYDQIIDKGWGVLQSKDGSVFTQEDIDDHRSLLARHVPYLMQNHRDKNKLYTGYVKPVDKWVDPITNIYHPEFNIFGTITGRLSSGIHTIAKVEDIQSQFISKFPDGKIIAADYSAIEVRVLASFTGAPKLIQIFMDGVDIHRQVAAFAYRLPVSEITETQRRYSKTVHFGIIYLEGDDSLVGRLRGKGESITECYKRVRAFKDGYFAEFPEAKRYISDMQSWLKNKGVAHPLPEFRDLADKSIKRSLNRYLVTPFGRLLPVEPEADSWDLQVRAINWPIQSTATDMTTTAAIRINRRFRANKMRAHVIILIHDAIFVDCPTEELEEVLPIIREEMETKVPPWMKCPVKVDIEVGRSWGETKPLKDKGMKKGDRLAASNIK